MTTMTIIMRALLCMDFYMLMSLISRSIGRQISRSIGDLITKSAKTVSTELSQLMRQHTRKRCILSATSPLFMGQKLTSTLRKRSTNKSYKCTLKCPKKQITT